MELQVQCSPLGFMGQPQVGRPAKTGGSVRHAADQGELAKNTSVATPPASGVAATRVCQTPPPVWAFSGWQAAGMSVGRGVGAGTDHGLAPIQEHHPFDIVAGGASEDEESDVRHATPMYIPGLRDYCTIEVAITRAKRQLRTRPLGIVG